MTSDYSLRLLLTPMFDGPLVAQHTADLRMSGLTDETIARQRFRSVPPAMIRGLLGWDPHVSSALLLPYPDPAGGFLPHVRMKVFPAFSTRDGQTVKYLQPVGTPPRIYLPLATLPTLLHGRERLALCEGEKKSLLLAQLGIPAAGFAGIEGWHVAGSRDLLPDFDVIPLRHRVVDLVPDGDVQSNPHVERGATRFADALERRGANVRSSSTGRAGGRQMKGAGIDDHLVKTNGTAAEFDALPRIGLHPKLDAAAYHGAVGEFVTSIAPETEADPAGVLLNVLAGVGCMMGGHVGMGGGVRIEPPRLFVATVGETGIGRKGTAQAVADALLQLVDPLFMAQNVKPGLSTGEGLIYHVRDASTQKRPRREKGQTVFVDVTDDGVADKRLLVIEDEFAVVLRRMNDKQSTLSPLIRSAFDGRPLGTLTRNDPMRATGAHVAMCVQVTPAELHECLRRVEQVNGFANRFLWIAVRQQAELPEREFLPREALERGAAQIRSAVEFARSLAGDAAILHRDEDAKAAWAVVYRSCNAALREAPNEMFRSLLARGTTHILRLAAVLALLDETTTVREDHLEAACAIWQYSVESVKVIWGSRAEHRDLARLVAAHVRAGRPLSRTDQHRALHGHLPATELDALVCEAIERDLLARQPGGKGWVATENAAAAVRTNSRTSHGEDCRS